MAAGRTEYLNDPNAPKPNSLVPAAGVLAVDADGRVLLQRRALGSLDRLPSKGKSLLTCGGVLITLPAYGLTNVFYPDIPRYSPWGRTSGLKGSASPWAAPEAPIHRLVLWNIDLTLLDVARVIRAAYAEAFAAVTGRPLVRLPQLVGLTEQEIFFDALGRNGVSLRADGESERLLAPFSARFAACLADREALLTGAGQPAAGRGRGAAGRGRGRRGGPVGADRVKPRQRRGEAPRLPPRRATWTWTSPDSPAPSPTRRARCCGPSGCGRRRSTG